MTRSLRHHPFLSNTAHESEKTDKVLAHQRERKWFHDHLHPAQVTAEEDFDIVAYHEHPKSGRGLFAKSGKSWSAEEASAHRK